jgi:class 3 adenylate cyclase/F0F1-type ATP synthase membrane subunit b/b'
MDPPGLKRRLTCILATDAVDYSRLVNQDETGALRVLAAHRAVIDGVIAYHDGRIANTAGDSVLAEFGSVVEGVRAAVEIQDALKTRNESLPESQRMLFRIGINLGEVVVKGNDLLGDGVNVAARLQSIAPPGGILVSSSVYDQITGKLDLGFQDMGEQELKNISRPIRAFSVSGTAGALRPSAPPTKPPVAPVPAPRRLGPIAIVALAALGIGALLAITQGWLRPSPPEPRVDVAKAKLEADLAAADKARVDAEQRAKAADAETARLRAESEASALKAKAATDAAAIRAKAETDAAALRAKAAGDASRAKAPAPPAVAAAAPIPATPIARADELRRPVVGAPAMRRAARLAGVQPGSDDRRARRRVLPPARQGRRAGLWLFARHAAGRRQTGDDGLGDQPGAVQLRPALRLALRRRVDRRRLPPQGTARLAALPARAHAGLRVGIAVEVIGMRARDVAREREVARQVRGHRLHGPLRVAVAQRPRDRPVLADRLRRATELRHGDRPDPVMQVARLGDHAPHAE